ncbi:hypothetical protein [Actinomadura pelletieri]|uniref:hypothetical protein n=1 Tax=Actinomadura pelletieri TaxID=111805 RepID=UPI000EB2AB16|nr:hypothetical protein [Actinomadura pelletieri]
MPNRLDIAVVSPEDSPWRRVESRFLIDGEDVIKRVFDKGPGEDPDRLLIPPSPLIAANGPTTVRLAEAICSWGCCGCVEVRIHREDDAFVWSRWHNPDTGNVALGEFRFDAGQYTAELLRIHHDRAWEWRGRTVARFTRASLAAQPEVLRQWNCGLDSVGSLPDQRDDVQVLFTCPPRQAIHQYWQQHGQPLEHTQYRLRFPVTDEPAEEQADRIVTTLRTEDPRDIAEPCGGWLGHRSAGGRHSR